MQYDHINVPADGEAITINPDHTINVPDFPIIPYIEGDGQIYHRLNGWDLPRWLR